MAQQSTGTFYRVARALSTGEIVFWSRLPLATFKTLGGGVTTIVIVKVKIWLLSPPNLILGDILRSLAFSEIFSDEKKPLPGQNHILDLQW